MPNLSKLLLLLSLFFSISSFAIGACPNGNPRSSFKVVTQFAQECNLSLEKNGLENAMYKCLKYPGSTHCKGEASRSKRYTVNCSNCPSGYSVICSVESWASGCVN